MAAFNFPNSPSTNDLHTENNVTWKWNGTVWKRIHNSYLTASTLDVSGIGTFGGNVSIADKIIHTGDTNTALRFPAADTFSVETGGGERLRITSTGDVLTGGLTSRSFENDSSNQSILEVTGGGSAGNYGMINISGNSNSDDGAIGRLNFINRENSNSTSVSNAGSKNLGYIDVYTDTSDSNAGDDSGGYMRFATKSESGGATERLRITSDGKVGINDTSPDSIFSVKDTYIFSCAGGNSTTGMQIGGYDAGANSYNPITVRASQILFNISGTEKARIDSSGTLSLSSQNPNIRFDDSDTSNNGEITLDNTQLRIEVDEDNAVSNSALKFRIDGGDVAVINSDGEMGVGTNNPDAMLHVSKSVSTAYNAGADSAQRSGTATINIENNDGTTNSFAQIAFDTAGSNQSIARIVALRTGTSSNALTFITEHNNTKAERLRIDSSGRMILGGTASFADGNSDDFQLQGTAHTGMIIKSGTSHYGSIYFGDGTSGDDRNKGIVRYGHSDDAMQFWTSAAERLRIKSDGNVAINSAGTATNLLDVRKDATSTKVHIGSLDGTLGSMPNSSEYGISLVGNNAEFQLHKDGSGNYQLVLGTYQGSIDIPLVFRTGNRAERLRIDSSGNVLIGTTSATSEFTVRGGGTVAAFEGTGGSGSIMIKDVDDGTLAYALVDGGNFDIQTSGSSYSTKLRVTPGGDVLVKTGDLKIETNNKGINFSGSSSSPDSNSTSSTRVMTDYDEGTCDWELHRSDGLTTGDNNSMSRVTYTKIGDRVFMSGYIYTASTGSSTGVTARLTNASGGDAELPYTPNHSGGMPIIHTRTIDEYARMSVSFQANGKTVYVHTDEGNNSYTPDQNDVSISNSQTHLVLAFTGSYETSQ